MSRTVGCVGVGIMGSRMCQNLLKSGFRVVAYDLSPAALRAAAERGIAAAPDLPSLAREAEVVLLSLPTPALFILTPVLMPMVKQYGIDPIHFGVMMVLNLMIGLVTPPVGTVLYTLMRVTGLSLERLSWAMLPWYVPLVISLVLVTLFPGISTWLPGLMLGR